MKLNTVIELPDGRIGTICYNNLDGRGGVWGHHTFTLPPGGFGDLPEPDFMLREPSEKEMLIRMGGHKTDVECVGSEFEVVSVGDNDD